jgi:anti-sigma B factor antagonist
MTFSISTTEDGLTRLAIEGELDAVSVSDLRGELENLLTRRPTRVDIDLSRLRMVDSSGVGALVSLYKRVRAQGGSIVVSGLRDQPLAIFRLLRLDRVMASANLAPSTTAPKSSTSGN